MGLDPWLDCGGVTVSLSGSQAPVGAGLDALQKLTGVAQIEFQLNSSAPVGYADE